MSQIIYILLIFSCLLTVNAKKSTPVPEEESVVKNAKKSKPVSADEPVLTRNKTKHMVIIVNTSDDFFPQEEYNTKSIISRLNENNETMDESNNQTSSTAISTSGSTIYMITKSDTNSTIYKSGSGAHDIQVSDSLTNSSGNWTTARLKQRKESDKSNVIHLVAFIIICSAILFCLVGIDPQQDLHLEQMEVN